MLLHHLQMEFFYVAIKFPKNATVSGLYVYYKFNDNCYYVHCSSDSIILTAVQCVHISLLVTIGEDLLQL